MRYSVETSIWRVDEHDGIVTLGHRDTYTEADALRSSYFLALVADGGTGSWDRPSNQYTVAMPDGTTEYVRITKFGQ